MNGRIRREGLRLALSYGKIKIRKRYKDERKCHIYD